MLLVVLIVCFGPALPAYAATITVTTTADEFSNPGPGSGCSLREAVQAANTNAAFGGCPAGSGADTINVPAGAYTLTRTGAQEDLNVTGDLDIRAATTIVGAGAANTILDGNQIDRLFHVLDGSGSFTLSGVTITRGASGPDSGGGVLNRDASFTVSDSVFSANSGRSGGAIDNFGGSLIVTNTTISGNSATTSGGGIRLYTGTGTLTSTTITANNAVQNGGGLWNGGTLTVTASTVTTNSAPDGAGIYSSGGPCPCANPPWVEILHRHEAAASTTTARTVS